MSLPAGRVHCLCICTRSGHVVYERFYDGLSEPEKAEIRGAFQQQLAGARGAGEEQECVGRFRNGRTVMLPSGELLLFGLGSGEYNELALSELLKAVAGALKEACRAPSLSDTALFQNYAAAVLVVDEACKEGIVEHTDKGEILKAIAFRVHSEGSDSKLRGKSSMRAMFSS